jgi:KRAB domain-containing zinc finger protein
MSFRGSRFTHHMKTCTGGRGLTHMCRVCDEEHTGASAWLLEHFKRLHPDQKPYACGECDRQFWQAKSWQSHEPRCNGMLPTADSYFHSKPAVCRVCASSFTSQKKLSVHFEHAHNNRRPFACNKYCGATFRHCFQASKHAITCIGVQKTLPLRSNPIRSIQSDPKCIDCNKTFSNYDEYIVHCFEVHHNTRPFRCDECSASFVQRETMLRHNRRCVKQVKCIQLDCARAFANNDLLVEHLRADHFS